MPGLEMITRLALGQEESIPGGLPVGNKRSRHCGRFIPVGPSGLWGTKGSAEGEKLGFQTVGTPPFRMMGILPAAHVNPLQGRRINRVSGSSTAVKIFY